MLVTAAAAVVGYAVGADTVAAPVHHIVEEPGAIERLTEIETPTEYYYQKLRSDLGERYPNASRHALDHLLSLEAFLDVSILSGFSFGCDKAQLLASEGSLLGRKVGRNGISGDGERAQAWQGCQEERCLLQPRWRTLRTHLCFVMG